MVVSDRDSGIRGGVDRAFLHTQLYPCTWHLMDVIKRRLAQAQMNSQYELIYRLVKPDLFIDPWAWVVFRRTLNDYLAGYHRHLSFRQMDGLLAVRRWAERNEPEIHRVLFTPHRPNSNGLVEEALRNLRSKLGERRRNFRNLPRLTLLLRLMMLQQIGEADADDWATILRENHLAYHAHPPPRRYLDGQIIRI